MDSGYPLVGIEIVKKNMKKSAIIREENIACKRFITKVEKLFHEWCHDGIPPCFTNARFCEEFYHIAKKEVKK